MTQLTLISPHQRPIEPLIIAALTNELHRLESGIKQTEQRLRQFEEKYQLSTDKFVQQFLHDELDETLEFTEWMGEYQLLERLNEKVAALSKIAMKGYAGGF